MKVNAYSKKLMTFAIFIITNLIMTSCDNILSDDWMDCSVDYRLSFRYDNNMKFADAFASEVKSVTLYVFDRSGTFIYSNTEQGDALSEEGYTMPLIISEGEYRLVTWAGTGTETSFLFPILTPGVSSYEDLSCRLDFKYDDENNAYTDREVKPLYHGHIDNYMFTEVLETEVVTMPLFKNTNSVRVVLQQMSGNALDMNGFTFSVDDKNVEMNYDNELTADEKITYYAWDKSSGTADSGEEGSSSVSVAVAEITIGKLIKSNHPVLNVRNQYGERILSIPLVDYALLVKGYYNRDMDDQEYLDRLDEYNMTFFLDRQGQWINSTIIINGWKVVFGSADLE